MSIPREPHDQGPTGPRTLPRWLTSFIGRERELADLDELISQRDMRLITLIGPGGVGKTRLALQLALDTEHVHPDGTWFVPLSLVTDASLVPAVVARAVAATNALASATEAAIERLSNAKGMLILDNFEHVLAGASIIPELLEACPQLTVVVTSRRPLNVAGERLVPVPPLSLPDPGSPASDVTTSDAVRLFTERAREKGGTFALTSENQRVIADICRLLDGLPLAIELASPWLRAVSPAALLARLDRRLPLLESGPRDAPSRQRTMRATIAWSHVLLDPEEQRLFRSLAVFIGGFSLDAIPAIVGGVSDDATLLERLGALIDHSLVRAMPLPAREAAWDPPRYIMIETIREFALEQLEIAGEADSLRERHAAWCLRLAEESTQDRIGMSASPVPNRLATERHNARAALTWLEQRGEIGPALELATALWPLWLEHGEIGPGRTYLGRLLAHPAAQHDRPRWARAMVVLGQLEQGQGELDAAERTTRDALAVLEELGDERWLGSAFTTVGLVALVQGDASKASDMLERSLGHFRNAGDVRAGSWSLRHLSTVAYRQGDIDRYERLATEGLAIIGPDGNPLDHARLGASIALAATMRGRLEDATARFEAVLSLYRRAGDHWGEADALQRLGHLAYLRGNDIRARDLLEQSIHTLRRIGDPEGLARVLSSQGWVARRQGDLVEAARRFSEAALIAHHHGVKRSLAKALVGQATIQRDTCDVRAAATTLIESLTLSNELGDPILQVTAIEHAMRSAVDVDSHATARLAGYTGALRESIGIPLPASEQQEHALLLRTLRQRLGEEQFTTQTQLGAALPVNEAVSLTREMLGRASHPSADRHVPLVAPDTDGLLSRRERMVLRLLTAGRSDREIAETLGISHRTAATHVQHIYRKLGVSSRAEAAAWAVRRGLA